MKRFICRIDYLFSRKRRECKQHEFEEAQRAAQQRLGIGSSFALPSRPTGKDGRVKPAVASIDKRPMSVLLIPEAELLRHVRIVREPLGG
jgi:hypothetical protein